MKKVVVHPKMFDVRTMTMAMAFLVKILQYPEMALPYFHLVLEFGCDVAQDTDPVGVPICIGVYMVVVLMVRIQYRQIVLIIDPSFIDFLAQRIRYIGDPFNTPFLHFLIVLPIRKLIHKQNINQVVSQFKMMIQ
jgi:hypothetical protein